MHPDVKEKKHLYRFTSCVRGGNFYVSLLLLGWFCIFIGLPNSKFLMSAGQFIVAGIVVILYLYKKQCIPFSSFMNSTFYSVVAFYLVHLVGLFYTSNYDYAWHDLRIKLPVLSIPVLWILSFPLIQQYRWELIRAYILSVTLTLLIGIFRVLILCPDLLSCFRQVSPFISHIRLALMIVLSMYFLLLHKHLFPSIVRIVLLGFMVVSLLAFGLYSGLIVLALTLILYALYLIIKKKRKERALGSLILTGFSAVIFYVVYVVHQYNTMQVPKEYPSSFVKTPNEYYFRMDNNTLPVRENGYLVFDCIAREEVKRAWNQRSSKPFKSDENVYDNPLFYTLLRYLSSKGLPKDSSAIYALSAHEIKAIENGVPNYLYLNASLLRKRIYQTLWEVDVYRYYGMVNEKTLIMRWLYWINAFHVWQDHFWWGTGTGDINDALYAQYEVDKSPLLPEYQHEAHNQYLTVAATWGLFGLIVFVSSHIYLFYLAIKRKHLLSVIFLLIIAISMITDDTLETQAGVTFYALFLSYFFLPSSAGMDLSNKTKK